MDERDAVLLDNFFPEPTYVTLRKGYAVHATGMSGTIKTLMEWSGPTGRKLKAAVGGEIFDVTSSGAVGAAEVTGLASDEWEWVNFGTAGGNFLLAVNGSDDPQNYDGTTWATTPAITGSGLTASNLSGIAVHKSRVWFIEKDTLNAWYLPVNSIGGTATKQAMGAIFKLGGSLQAIGTMSRDSGDGVDDYLAFVSSRGQVAVYQGTDPDSATTWALVGVYRIGYPIGKRCVLEVGGDLAITTSDGVVSLMKMMELDRAASGRAAITDKIQNLFNRAVLSYQSNFGWQGIVYPKGTRAIFNIPLNTSEFHQYVMNTITGAWCRFKNMNAACWGLMGDDLYFGGTDGKVYLADTGYTDNTGILTAQMRTAWNYFKSRGRNKLFQLYRPVIQTNGSPSVLMAMNTDFQELDPTGTADIGNVTSSLWGTDNWGTATWAGDGSVTALWNGAGNIGYCGAIVMKVTSEGQSFLVNSFDVQATMGGAL